MEYSPRQINPNECYAEFSESFSAQYHNKFLEVFNFYKTHAIDENSLIRKLHLGYTAMRPEAFDFVAKEFPWLEMFRLEMGLEKKLNFLETHGLTKPKFEPHIDGKIGEPEVMFNMPILNCTNETITTWVEPLTCVDTHLAAENYSTNKTAKGATPHLPHGTEYRTITSHSLVDRAALFRSDVFHQVENNTNRDEYRIMMHWWFPPHTKWDSAMRLLR